MENLLFDIENIKNDVKTLEGVTILAMEKLENDISDYKNELDSVMLISMDSSLKEDIKQII